MILTIAPGRLALWLALHLPCATNDVDKDIRVSDLTAKPFARTLAGCWTLKSWTAPGRNEKLWLLKKSAHYRFGW